MMIRDHHNDIKVEMVDWRACMRKYDELEAFDESYSSEKREIMKGNVDYS